MAISKEQAMRPALNDVIDAVNQIITDIEPYITAAVDAWLDENGGTYISEYITEHGLEVGYTVTDGDLAVVLQ